MLFVNAISYTASREATLTSGLGINSCTTRSYPNSEVQNDHICTKYSSWKFQAVLEIGQVVEW